MTISGMIGAGYESVADALATNAHPTGAPGQPGYDPGDLGASLCVISGSEVVVDAWHGDRDLDGGAWQRDTLVNMYSVGKPVAAVLALDSVARGELDLDGPLLNVWPELAAHSAATTLRHALTHQAGLPAVASDLEDDAILSWATMAEALAATPPWWEPGTAHGYHVNTYGFLVGEPVCRAAGMSFRDALFERLCRRRGFDLHIGLRGEDLARCSIIDTPGADRIGSDRLGAEPDWPTRTAAEQMVARAYFNPRTMSGMGVVNTAPWRQASVPSTNGHATARGVAQFYAALLPGAADPLLPPELLAEATTEQVNGHDRVIGRTTRFGLGFQLHDDKRPIGTSPAAYGHFGFGGSLAFADPTHDLAFAYLINRPGDRWQNPRTLRLLDALRSLSSLEADIDEL